MYSFHEVPLVNARHQVVHGLDLTMVRQVFVTVKGYNEAGLYSSVTSNGVFISHVSSGMPPLGLSIVYDGLGKEDL